MNTGKTEQRRTLNENNERYKRRMVKIEVQKSEDKERKVARLVEGNRNSLR